MTSIHGLSLVAGKRSQGIGPTFSAISPIDATPLPGEFHTATEADVATAMEAARDAAAAFRATDGETRARFLEAIADGIVALGDALIERARLETGLAEARLLGERGRTVGQLRMFAQIARECSWHDPRIETAIPARQPIPKVDLRRMLVPIGPVVVFGASNFPLAFSVAGGDTASALATGNPVVVKAHEAHPGTSELVAEVIARVAAELGLPAGIFSHLQGSGKVLGPQLATHPATRAIGFTGSAVAGRALFDAAASRPDPIPVFAEMGSLNPIVVLESSFNPTNSHADLIAQSITQGVGQFCTKPGIILIPVGESAVPFRTKLVATTALAAPGVMLHAGIAKAFAKSCESLEQSPALRPIARSAEQAHGCQGAALLMETTAAEFLADDSLRHEVFGPFAIVVTYASEAEIFPVLRSLGGQLTASVFGSTAQIRASGLLETFTEIAGRVIVNGVPTGVEVCAAMQHGGPWPASSDSRFTSVGTAALLRFVRPVAYQNVPDALLPAPLQNANPLKISRLINGNPSLEPL
jgi:alpha-ketoglutaric semialdehyde dehydrogenase